MKLKEYNNKWYGEYFGKKNVELMVARDMLDNLYTLHHIAHELLELDGEVRDRVCAAIRKEQIKLENFEVE